MINVKGKMVGIFSLTGAGFSYSSYQHPRRDTGKHAKIALVGALVLAICDLVLFNVLILCLRIQKYIILKTLDEKI